MPAAERSIPVTAPLLAVKHAIEQRTGWLFGLYARRREELTDPLFSVGFTIESSGGLDVRSGIYMTLGNRGIYLCRADGLERHIARQIQAAENYANTEESR